MAMPAGFTRHKKGEAAAPNARVSGTAQGARQAERGTWPGRGDRGVARSVRQGTPGSPPGRPYRARLPGSAAGLGLECLGRGLGLGLGLEAPLGPLPRRLAAPPPPPGRDRASAMTARLVSSPASGTINTVASPTRPRRPARRPGRPCRRAWSWSLPEASSSRHNYRRRRQQATHPPSTQMASRAGESKQLGICAR